MDYPLIKPRYYFSLFQDITRFIKKPINLKSHNKSTKLKIYDTIGLFILKLLCLIPISVIIGLTYDPENLSKSNMVERFSPLVLLLVTVIILPAVEEICFRLSLKFKPIYLAMSVGVFSYYVLTKAVFHTKISLLDDSFLTRLFGALGLVAFTYLIVQFSESLKRKLTKFWEKNFSWIYYASCLSFAWIHIFNYELNWMNLLFLPIITLPQLLSAIISGYTRVSFGFQYPLLFHMFTNLIVTSLLLIAG